MNQAIATTIYLFDKQIFHRDIKLENILYIMDKDNKYLYKFADFGEGELNAKSKLTSTRSYFYLKNIIDYNSYKRHSVLSCTRIKV